MQVKNCIYKTKEHFNIKYYFFFYFILNLIYSYKFFLQYIYFVCLMKNSQNRCFIYQRCIKILYHGNYFVIPRNCKEIDDVRFQVPIVQNQVERQQEKQIQSFKFYQIYGMTSLPFSPVLIFVVDRIRSAQINGHEIFLVKQVGIVKILQSIDELEKELKQSFKLMKFYYSSSLNFAQKFQSYFEQSPIPQNEFISNLTHTLTLKNFPNELFVPFFTGFAKTVVVQQGDILSRLTIISRGDVRRLGRRWLRRGLGNCGSAANTYQTEIILEIIQKNKHTIFAFNQVRGSIPLLWQQRPCFFPKAKLKVSEKNEQSRRLLRNYLLGNAQRYGPTTYLNLIDKSGDQLLLGNKFVQQFQISQRVNDQLIWFCYRDQYRKKNRMDLQTLGQCAQLRQRINNCGYFSAQTKGGSFLKSLSFQRGIIRSNCMDCLDRTNSIQSIITQMAYLKFKSDSGVGGINIELALKELWLANGEAISEAYSGTHTMKRGIFLHGKSSFFDSLRDFTIGLKRFYLGHYKDAYYQNCIDLHFGRIKFTQDIKQFKYPLVKRIFSLVCLACTFAPLAALYPRIASIKNREKTLLAGCGSFFLGFFLSGAIHRFFHQQIIHEPISRNYEAI